MHRARLKDGSLAVVKVKRPGLGARTLRQKALVSLLAAPFPDIRSNLERCFDLFLAELDFEREADNIARFRELGGVCVVPRVLYCGDDALLMEYVPGTQLHHSTLPPATIVAKVIESYIAQIFVLGHVHGDPHPGNLAITDDGELVMYDFGCCLPVRSPEPMIAATLLRDAEWLQALLAKAGYLEKASCARERSQVTQSLRGMMTYLANADLQELHEKVAVFPPFTEEFMMLLRVFSSLEGVCRSVDPDFRLDSILPDIRAR